MTRKERNILTRRKRKYILSCVFNDSIRIHRFVSLPKGLHTIFLNLGGINWDRENVVNSLVKTMFFFSLRENNFLLGKFGTCPFKHDPREATHIWL